MDEVLIESEDDTISRLHVMVVTLMRFLRIWPLMVFYINICNTSILRYNSLKLNLSFCIFMSYAEHKVVLYAEHRRKMSCGGLMTYVDHRLSNIECRCAALKP